MHHQWSLSVTAAAALFTIGCTPEDDGSGPTSFVTNSSVASDSSETSTGDGDEDSTSGDSDTLPGSGDGDGDGSGDGDGDGDGSGGDGDGDGDGSGGDGDGSGGDGDGDGSSGDGDGDGGTGGDGDGDGDGGTGGDGDGDPNCGAPAEHITCDGWGDAVTYLQAIGLNCPGDDNNSTPTTADSLTAADLETHRIATQYGSSGDWVPVEGESLLVLSTGKIPAPNDQGLIVADGSQQETTNPDNVPLPAPLSVQQGSNNGAGGNPFNDCDLVNDCSDSLLDQWQLGGEAANDLLSFEFGVDVPAGTHGWIVDFVYFSNEFPEFVDSLYNDVFVVWETSEDYVGNICFVDGQPCTVTALDTIADDFSGPNEAAHPSLAGTGTQGSGDTGGQTTGWVSLEGPASPGENLELTFAVFDMGDDAYDTMVVLDNWRWNCQGCVPSEVDDCGVQPQ